MVGFAVHGAGKVIGMDVSVQALMTARKRLDYHEWRSPYELVRTYDSLPRVPLPDESVDYIHCGGVLQHTSDPNAILREFARVLRSGGEGRIMVYQENSIWLHLYVAYVVRVLQGKYRDMQALEAFRLCTDGEDCPVSRCYDPSMFLAMLGGAGLEGRYLGGYLSHSEVVWHKAYRNRALMDRRLEPHHRVFLMGVRKPFWSKYPRYDGLPCGVHGCFAIRRVG